MATMLLLLHVMMVLLALALTIASAFSWAEAAYVDPGQRKNARAAGRWLPLRMSNCLILLSAIYCVMTCVQHRIYSSMPELFVCAWVIVAGAALSAKGY